MVEVTPSVLDVLLTVLVRSGTTWLQGRLSRWLGRLQGQGVPPAAEVSERCAVLLIWFFMPSMVHDAGRQIRT